MRTRLMSELGRRTDRDGAGFGGADSDSVPMVGTFSTSNYFRNTTAADANPFDATPFALGAYISTGDLVNGDNGIVIGKHSVGNASGAYLFQDVGTPNQIELAIYNGAAGVIVSPTLSILPNKSYVVGCSYDGTTVRFFTRSGEVGSGTATTGYTANSTVGISVGNPNFTTKVFVGGFCLGNQILTAGQWTTWMNQVQAVKDVVSLPAGNVLEYSVKRGMPVGGPASNPWVPSVGTNNTLEMTGTVNYVRRGTPWGN